MLSSTVSLYAAEHSYGTRAKRKEHPQGETGPQPKKFESLPASPPLIPSDSSLIPLPPQEYLSLVRPEPILSREQQEIARCLLLTALVAQNKQLNKRLEALEAQQKQRASMPVEIEEQINKLKNSVDTHVEIMHAKITEVDALCVHRHAESQTAAPTRMIAPTLNFSDQKALAQLQEAITKLQYTVNGQATSIKFLKRNTEELSDLSAKSGESRTGIKARIKAIEAQYRSLVNKTVPKEALTELEKSLQLLTRRVNCHTRSIKALKKNGGEETDRLKALEVSLDKLGQQYRNIAKQATEHETKLKSQENALAVLNKNLEEANKTKIAYAELRKDDEDSFTGLGYQISHELEHSAEDAHTFSSPDSPDKVLPMPDLFLPELSHVYVPELLPAG